MHWVNLAIVWGGGGHPGSTSRLGATQQGPGWGSENRQAWQEMHLEDISNEIGRGLRQVPPE